MAQQEGIHLPMQETWVPSLRQDDPLEKEMVTHSSFVAWRIPMDRRVLAGCSPWGCRVGHDLATIPRVLPLSHTKQECSIVLKLVNDGILL